MFPDMTSVPLPDCFTPPLPETAVDSVTVSDRLNASVALLTIVEVASEPAVEPAPTVNVPAETVKLPVNVFVAVRTASPDPVFARFPLPEMTPATVSVLPLATETELDVPVASAKGLLESRLSVSVAESVPPLSVSVAGARSVASEIATVPALTVSAPVCELLPESVSVPLPCLVKLPLLPDITPEYVVSPEPPAINVPEPSVIAPEPEIDATVSVRLLTSNVPDAPTTMSEEFEMHSSFVLTRNVPPLTVTSPVNVFAPVSTRVPVPVLTMSPVPLINDGYVHVRLPLSGAPTVGIRLNVMVALLTMLPNLIVRSTGSQLDRSIVRLLPASTVTAPVNVLLPVSDKPPEPLIVTPPEPLMTPL